MINRFVDITRIFTLILFLISMVFSCEKEVKFTVEEQSLELLDNAEIAINYPKLNASNKSSTLINNALENYMASQLILDDTSEVPETLLLAATNFDNEFKTFKEAFPDSAQQWEAFIDAEVTHQSSELLCIAVNTYLDTGGAHGNSHIHFLNFEPDSGKQYTREELITAAQELEPYVKDYLKKKSLKIQTTLLKIYSLAKTLNYLKVLVLVMKA